MIKCSKLPFRGWSIDCFDSCKFGCAASATQPQDTSQPFSERSEVAWVGSLDGENFLGCFVLEDSLRIPNRAHNQRCKTSTRLRVRELRSDSVDVNDKSDPALTTRPTPVEVSSPETSAFLIFS